MSTIQSVHEVSASAGVSAVYQVTYASGTVSFVPPDPQNRDYIAMQAWIAAGGTLS